MDPEEIRIEIPPTEPEEPEVSEEDVDELVELVNEVKTTGDGHTETLGRIEACLSRLEAQQNSQTQSPLLAEIKAELVELRAELEQVKSSTVSTLKSLAPKESVEIVETPPLSEPSPENLMVVVPDGEDVEIPPTEPERKKRRFV